MRRARPKRFTKTLVCVMSAGLSVGPRTRAYPHDTPVNHVAGVEIVQTLGDIIELVN